MKFMPAIDILKKAMGDAYCWRTWFDFLDDEEVAMILNAMEVYGKQRYKIWAIATKRSFTRKR